LRNILSNPALSPSQKQEIIKALTQGTGGNAEANKAVKNLLGVMSENGRLGHLDGVVGAFEKIMRAHKGEIEVVVTSSQVSSFFSWLMKPLDQRTLSRLEQSISKSPLIQKGQKVRMENKVSETILGGLIVEIGDRTIDLSVQSRVSKLNQLLYETL
jgi:F-type H+-transporting ATPase subunit O